MLRAIKEYMEDYWNKYPNEKKHDPSIEYLSKLAIDNSYILTYGFFCIYTKVLDETHMLYYCFDFQNNLRESVKAHRAFTKDKKVFIDGDIKEVYKRNKIAILDVATNRWRFL